MGWLVSGDRLAWVVPSWNAPSPNDLSSSSRLASASSHSGLNMQILLKPLYNHICRYLIGQSRLNASPKDPVGEVTGPIFIIHHSEGTEESVEYKTLKC